MSKNRVSNPVIPNYTPRKEAKREEVTLTFSPCCVCQKPITEGYYARVVNGGTCNKTCWNKYQQEKPSLIDYVIPTKEK